jgi:hypothetical protein
MRRNDAAGERGALADTAAAGPDVPRRRPDDDHLRQRLAGLRASHPSSPEYRDREAPPEYRDGEASPEWGEAEAEPGAGSPGAGTAGPGERAGAAEPDGSGHGRGPAEGKPGGLPGPDSGLPGQGGGLDGEPGHARPGPDGPARAVPLGGGEPYRPWFSSGEPLEPWFTGDPGDPPG